MTNHKIRGGVASLIHQHVAPPSSVNQTVTLQFKPSHHKHDLKIKYVIRTPRRMRQTKEVKIQMKTSSPKSYVLLPSIIRFDKPKRSGRPRLNDSCLNINGTFPQFSFTRRNPYRLSCRIKLEILFVLKSCLSLEARTLAVNFVGFSMTTFSPSWLQFMYGIKSSFTKDQSL